MTYKIFNGVKAISINDLPEEAWHYLAGGPEKIPSGDVRSHWSVVAVLYRAVAIRAQAVASLPFALVDQRARRPQSSPPRAS